MVEYQREMFERVTITMNNHYEYHYYRYYEYHYYEIITIGTGNSK